VEETEDAEKMGFLAAIRGKSQRWVALSCDAHLVSSCQGRIRQPCVQSSYWDQTRANIFLMSTILRGKLAINVYEYGRGGKCVYMFRHTNTQELDK